METYARCPDIVPLVLTLCLRASGAVHLMGSLAWASGPPSSRASPKSATLARPLSDTSTLRAARSRCTTRRASKYSIPEQVSLWIWTHVIFNAIIISYFSGVLFSEDGYQQTIFSCRQCRLQPGTTLATSFFTMSYIITRIINWVIMWPGNWRFLLFIASTILQFLVIRWRTSKMTNY